MAFISPSRRRSSHAATFGVLLTIIAVAGCNCDEKGKFGVAAPKIIVDPNPIVLTDANVGLTRQMLVKVTNDGTLPLRMLKDPEVVDKTGASIDFGVVNKFAADCDGNPRPEGTNLSEIAPTSCVTVGLNYRANADGAFEAKLRFATNQTNLADGILDVPITGAALTPHIKACLYEGETEIACGTSGMAFDAVISATPVAVGSKVNRTLKLIADGTGEVKVTKYTATGDVDFTVTPGPADFQSTTIPSGKSFDLGVEFAPLAGGPRTMTLTFDNTDPGNQPLVVNLNASADGPALCYCIGEDGAQLCKPLPTADFGVVATGSKGRKYVRLASCGTQPVTFTNVEVTNTDASPVFGATGLPAANTVLAPNANPIEAGLTFAPTQVKSYVGANGGGRLVIQTSNQRAFIDLVGNGIEGGCKLTAATMTVDFGQGAKGQTSQRILSLSNPGGEDCVFPTQPTITVGAGEKFDVVNYPMMPLPAGMTTRVTLSYTPQDTMGPDIGEVTIPYAGASNPTAVSNLVVALKGTPVAVATCKLEALPAAGTFITGRALNFGQVRVSTTKVLPVTFRNVGSANCTVSTGKLGYGIFADANTKAGFKVMTTPKSPLVPGDSTTIDVSFTPTTEAQYGAPTSGFDFAFGASLIVNTSDTATFDGQACQTAQFGGTAAPGCVAWSLTGAGARADLQILPGDLDFGLVTVGCQSPELSITIYNTGSAAINIKKISVDPPTPSGQTPTFTVVPPPTPFVLAGGAQRKIPVRYRPPDANPHAASIFIESDASNSSLMTVSLKGRGTTDAHQTDTFTQNSTPKTDVLFVVDDSGSMGEEQGFLASNAQAFINEAQKLNTDFQIAVVTTDMDDAKKSGNFQGSPKIVKPGANASTQLSNNFKNLGTNGSATEQGLAAMTAALSPPLINDPMKNGGFLRPDAKLAVVIVSDEEDQSSGSLNFYIDFLKNIKGFANQSMVTMSAIVGDTGSGCMSSNGDAEAGERYINVQTATAGKFRSICSSNWGAIAQDLGLDAFAARAGYQLTRWAIASTIVVKVNGTVSPNGNWTYDPSTNTVNFGALFVPPAGATVVIDYDTICY